MNNLTFTNGAYRLEKANGEIFEGVVSNLVAHFKIDTITIIDRVTLVKLPIITAQSNNLQIGGQTKTFEQIKTIIETELAKGGGASSADAVSYDNSTSGLQSTNVQGAIDEIGANLGEISPKVDSLMDRADLVSVQAENVGYGTSNVKDALDKKADVTKLEVNMFDNGNCDSVSDISVQEKSVELLQGGGLRISGTTTTKYPQLTLGTFAKVIGHRYVVVIDCTSYSNSQLFWCGNNSNTDAVRFTTINGTRGVYAFEITASVSNNTAYIQMSQTAQLDLYAFMIFDCGNDATKTTDYYKELYLSNGFFVRKESVKNSEVSDMALAIKDTKDNYSFSKKSKLANNLTFAMVGDSITNLGFDRFGISNANGNGWIYLCCEELGLDLSNFTNYGIGGNRLSKRGEQSTTSTPMVERITSIDNKDIIVVMGGTNDCESGTILKNENNLYDENTIFGSVGSIAKKVSENYPNSVLVFCIPPRREGSEWNSTSFPLIYQIAPTIIEACEYFGIPYIDFFHYSGINFRTIHHNANLVNGLTITTADIDKTTGQDISGSRYAYEGYVSVDKTKRIYAQEGTIYEYDSNQTYLGYTDVPGNSYFELKLKNNTSYIRYVSRYSGQKRVCYIDGDLISDGVHPNRRGMVAMAKYFAKEIQGLIYQYNYGNE